MQTKVFIISGNFAHEPEPVTTTFERDFIAVLIKLQRAGMLHEVLHTRLHLDATGADRLLIVYPGNDLIAKP